MSKLKQGFFYLMAGSLGQSIFRVVFTAVLARLLSPEDFGIIATATIVTGFAEMMVQFGFGQALIQKKDINKKDIGTAFSSSTIVGLLFMMIVMLSSKSLAIFFEQPELEKILFFLSLLFPIKGFNQVQFALLQRNMRFKSLAGRDVLSYVFGYGIFGISLAVLGYGVKSLMIAILMQSIMYTFLLWVTLKSNSIFFRFSYSSFKHLYSVGMNLTAAKIYNYLALKGDYFIVGKLLGAESLGFYSRGYGLMNIPTGIIGNSLNTVLFSQFSRNQNNLEESKRGLLKAYKNLFILSFGIMPICYFFSSDLILVLLGEKWISVVPIFRILVFGLSFRLIYKVSGSFLKGIGFFKFQRKTQGVYMLIVVVLSYIGAQFGVLYVAWSVNMAIVLNFLMLTTKTFNILKVEKKEINELLLSVIPITIFSFLFSFISFKILEYLGTNSIINLIVVITVFPLIALSFEFKYHNILRLADIIGQVFKKFNNQKKS